MLETFDWQWRNGGVRDEHPEYDLLPSEYFRRQIYGCFWFEEQAALDAIAQYPDNILFETDYPHPTCQHPGPAHARRSGRATTRTRRCSAACPTTSLRKVLHDNAAAVYGLAVTRRDRELDAPDLGTPHLVAHVDGRVLHLRIDRVERRNAFTQDMYRGLKRAAIWADAPARARRGVPHRHRRLVRRRRRHGRPRRGPRGPRRRVGRHRPLPVPPHRALPQAVGGEDQRRCATPVGSTSPCTAT